MKKNDKTTQKVDTAGGRKQQGNKLAKKTDKKQINNPETWPWERQNLGRRTHHFIYISHHSLNLSALIV